MRDIRRRGNENQPNRGEHSAPGRSERERGAVQQSPELREIPQGNKIQCRFTKLLLESEPEARRQMIVDATALAIKAGLPLNREAILDRWGEHTQRALETYRETRKADPQADRTHLAFAALWTAAVRCGGISRIKDIEAVNQAGGSHDAGRAEPTGGAAAPDRRVADTERKKEMTQKSRELDPHESRWAERAKSWGGECPTPEVRRIADEFERRLRASGSSLAELRDDWRAFQSETGPRMKNQEHKEQRWEQKQQNTQALSWGRNAAFGNVVDEYLRAETGEGLRERHVESVRTALEVHWVQNCDSDNIPPAIRRHADDFERQLRASGSSLAQIREDWLAHQSGTKALAALTGRNFDEMVAKFSGRNVAFGRVVDGLLRSETGEGLREKHAGAPRPAPHWSEQTKMSDEALEAICKNIRFEEN